MKHLKSFRIFESVNLKEIKGFENLVIQKAGLMQMNNQNTREMQLTEIENEIKRYCSQMKDVDIVVAYLNDNENTSTDKL
jgi:hypothetical protein